MSDPTPIEDQAETIAEQRQRIQGRRTTVAVVSFLALVMLVSLWLALSLGLAVRLFRLAAGWG